MRILFSFFAVIALVLSAYAGVKIANLQFLFGVVIPYIAIAIFILGFIYRVLKWEALLCRSAYLQPADNRNPCRG